MEKLTLWIQDRFIRNKSLNSTRVVALSFGLIILLGALLLTLPIASRDGHSAGFFTGLFTATSATCVTGLVVADTWTQWSLFGQVVILGMIQLGGLGFMTVITLISLLSHRRIGLSERLIMVSTLNLNDLDGVVRVVRHALMGTAVFEVAGALLMAIRLIPRFGVVKGIWHSIFHSVSAFCNAGFDLMGGSTGPYSSLAAYHDDPIILITTAVLIIVGGLGFFVWEDVARSRCWRKLTIYTKLVLALTGMLLVFGTVFFFFAEGSNAGTMGGMGGGERLLNSFFQSTTLRTAGFNVVDQGAMRDGSKVISCVLMLIGGSSGSTAGGLKTVTVWVLFMVLLSSLRGHDTLVFRGRSLSARRALNAVTLFMMVTFLFVSSAVVISLLDDVPFLSAAFETASALGTVGVTTGITSHLSMVSQIILIVLMYTGRVGVLSFSLAFIAHKNSSAKIKYPEFNIMLG